MRVTLIDLWAREGMLHYVAQLGNSLARLPDMEVTVLVPRGSDVNLFEAAVAVDFVDVVKGASLRELLLVPLKLLELPLFFETIRRTKPDVIHLNNCHVWYIFTLPRLRRRYPVVSTLHDVTPHPGLDDTWRKRREIDTVARLSHHIFVHGHALKQQLMQRHPEVPEDMVTVIPMGDFSFFAQGPGGGQEERNTALFFGRIRDYKGLEYFIGAAKLVARELPNARFLIAGAGDLRPYQPLINDEPGFEIHNYYIPDDQVATLFQRAGIVVLPYVEASQSAVIPIAYAFKKPVVTTRVGCLPDVVEDGQTGLLVPPHDVSTLAEAMIKLLGDDNLRKSLGSNAYRKLGSELAWEGIVSTTLGVYRAVT